MTQARAIVLLAAAGLMAGGAAGRSRKQRLAELSEEDRVWSTGYVAPIIRPSSAEKDRFIRDFFKRRR